MADDKKEKKKEKRSSALKRDLQHEKRRLRHKSFRSLVRTAVRHLEELLAKGDQAGANESLKSIYSLMDKGVKKGTYTVNKAGRDKSRLAARVAAIQ